MVEKGILLGVFSRRIGVNSVDICYGGPYDSDKALRQIEELQCDYKIEPRQENPNFFARSLKVKERELWWDGRFRQLTPDGKIEFSPGELRQSR